MLKTIPGDSIVSRPTSRGASRPTTGERDRPTASEEDRPTSRGASRPTTNEGDRPTVSEEGRGNNSHSETKNKTITQHQDSPIPTQKEANMSTTSPEKSLEQPISTGVVETTSTKVLDNHINNTTAVYMADPVPWSRSSDSLGPIALQDTQSTRKERKSRQWTDAVPDSTTAISLQAELDAKHSKFVQDKENAGNITADITAAAKIARIKQEQEARLKQYQDEDSALLASLEAELEKRRRDRLIAEKQRRLEVQNSLEGLVDSSLIPEVSLDESTVCLPSSPDIIREMPPVMYDPPEDLPAVITEPKDPLSSLDRMVADEETRKKIKGGEGMTQEQYEMVKQKMANQQLDRIEKLRHLDGEEQVALYSESSLTLQRVGRGYIGRKRALLFREKRDLHRKLTKGVLRFQACIRGIAGRKRYAEKRKLWLLSQKLGDSALNVQRCFRGYVGRKIVRKRRQFCRSRDLQRVYRGHMGRKAFHREKTRMQMIAKKTISANKIISLWRMKVFCCLFVIISCINSSLCA